MKSRTLIETGWQASEAINLTNGDDLLLIFVNLTLDTAILSELRYSVNCVITQ